MASSKIVDPSELTPEASRWQQESEVLRVATLWQLSESELEDLSTLGQRLADVSHWKNDPSEVVRFLRARPSDVDAAERMFRNMIAWRLANRVDTILQDYEPPPIMWAYYPGAVLRDFDRAGDPVYVGRIGVTDGVGMLQRFGRDEMIRHAIWIREFVSRGEWIQRYETRQGRPVRRVTLVEDLQGLSVSHLNRQLLSVYGEIMRLDQDNYPETAKKLIIIRAPLLFRTIWKMAKFFFDPGVVEKMVFVSAKHTAKVLEEYLDLHILPSCVIPEGQGQATDGMPSRFEGGPLPKGTDGVSDGK